MAYVDGDAYSIIEEAWAKVKVLEIQSFKIISPSNARTSLG